MKKILSSPLDKFQFFAIVIILILLVPLVLYGYIGIFTRYVADDYETAGALARAGFWGAQQYWYQTWSGRVSFFALVTLVEMIGIQAVPFLTAVCLTLWLVGLFWLFRQICSHIDIKHPILVSWLGASLVIFVTLRSLNQIHQILFWQTGLLTYVTYLIFLTYAAGLFTWRIRNSGQRPATFFDLLISLILGFALGGFSEVSIALQITLLVFGLGLLFIYSRVSFRKKARGILLAALVGSFLCLAVMALAPGNSVRMADFQTRPDFASLLLNSLKFLFTFLGDWIDKQPILVALTLLVPVIVGIYTAGEDRTRLESTARDRRLTIALSVSILAVFFFLWSGFFTCFFVMSAPPPDRALVIPQFVMVGFLATWAYQCGRLLSQSINPAQATPRFWKLLGTITLSICLLLGPIYASARIAGTIGESRTIALEWDERDAIIRAAVARGEKTVTVWYLQDLNRLGDYSSDPDFLVNRAAADYYHLDSILALDKE
ncbi:hypothetical protein LARV_02842 [Longilinea arvoryzae]|uniref:4-amino-4-deoxy-L-arabinose transferase n=1 Tax=Longilinea arvoryzae TaxID=360412 RepID=A0A0S7BKL1_9CHLR|nr:DUF6056 family protein [Longilinea arvoryzae]GAP15062.1 hypothetical protein LARV_02842 [Longilinea arvoryzae]